MTANHERKFILSILMLVFTCALSVVASIPVSAQAHILVVNPDRSIMKAQNAMRQGKLSVALEHYKKAQRKNLSDEHRIVVQNSICAISYMQGEYGAAADACTKVIDDDPSYWKAYITRGNAKRALGDFAGALTDFCEAKRLSPGRVNGSFATRCAS